MFFSAGHFGFFPEISDEVGNFSNIILPKYFHVGFGVVDIGRNFFGKRLAQIAVEFF